MSKLRFDIFKGLGNYFSISEITTVELAERIGVNASTIRAWRQQDSIPNIPTIIRIAQKLRVEPSEFFKQCLTTSRLGMELGMEDEPDWWSREQCTR